MNPTTTLGRIRATGLCCDKWDRLLIGLGCTDRSYDPNRRVTLGDVAVVTDAETAILCIKALDWPDVNVRRSVTAEVFLQLYRRQRHAHPTYYAQCLEALFRWCDGGADADLDVLPSVKSWAWTVDAAAARLKHSGTDAIQRSEIIAAFPPVALSASPS
jgi:hypothetical protein